MSNELWRTKTNRLRTLWERGEGATAYFATIPWPPALEIAAAYGMDAAIIDLEHSAIDLQMLEYLITAGQGGGMTCLVRPPGMDAAMVSRVLDSGADGILFPHVESVDHATAAAASVRYPPAGTRGWGGAHTRYALWQGTSVLDGGLPADRGVYSPEYVERTDHHVIFGLLIESRPGVAAIDEILEAAHPDFVMFGRGDFSAEVEFDPVACDEAFTRVYEAARRRGIGISLAPSQGDLFYPGCIVTVGLDALWLSSATSEAVQRGRSAVDGRGAPPAVDSP